MEYSAICNDATLLLSLFDKTDVRFRGLRGTMESVFQTLHKEGLGVEVKHASLVAVEEEEKLWETKTLGDHNPEVLLRTVFYLNGINIFTMVQLLCKPLALSLNNLDYLRKILLNLKISLLCSVTVWLYDSVLAACLKICVIGVTVLVCILPYSRKCLR